MMKSVAVPPIASSSAPATRAPIGISPTDSVRAVAPTRPEERVGRELGAQGQVRDQRRSR